MSARGKDQASTMFPHVAKNVISKNVELKKLVYMYLVHYAEVEPDAALLAINSFQKDLNASNQYIRGNFFFVSVILLYFYFIYFIFLFLSFCITGYVKY
jgi:vesicle coat complex subunit